MKKEELIGQIVESKAYGKGKIVGYDGHHVTVEFSKKTSDFQCPKAFLDGFLVAEDIKVHDALINEACDEQDAAEKEKELMRIEEEKRREEEKKSRGTRGEHKEFLYKGETFRTHADALNDCFGYNYKHFQTAFKRIDDRYAAWFPSIAKRVMDEYVAAETSYGWLNVLCENGKVILEKNVENPDRNTDRDRSWDIFVFAKFDGENAYTFIGLFRSNPKLTKDGFRYELLGTQIDLNTMEICK